MTELWPDFAAVLTDDAVLAAANDQAAAAWAAVSEARNAALAAWVGAIANFAVVATSIYLASASSREAARVRSEAERRGLNTVATQVELAYATMYLMLDQLVAAPTARVAKSDLLVSSVGPRAASEAAIGSAINDDELQSLATTAHGNMGAIMKVLELWPTESIEVAKFLERTDGLRDSLALNRKAFGAWLDSNAHRVRTKVFRDRDAPLPRSSRA